MLLTSTIQKLGNKVHSPHSKPEGKRAGNGLGVHCSDCKRGFPVCLARLPVFTITLGAGEGVGQRGRALGDKTVLVLGRSFSVASMLSMLALKESIMSPGSVAAFRFCIIAYAAFVSLRKFASSGAWVVLISLSWAILRVKSRDGSGVVVSTVSVCRPHQVSAVKYRRSLRQASRKLNRLDHGT